jgi:hypothetical protein
LRGEDLRGRSYLHYAKHCLDLVRIATSRKSRIIQREMAAEWFKLPIWSLLRNNLRNDDGAASLVGGLVVKETSTAAVLPCSILVALGRENGRGRRALKPPRLTYV